MADYPHDSGRSQKKTEKTFLRAIIVPRNLENGQIKLIVWEL